jgi:ribonucleoside-diphosphate reductase alpha chain
VRSLPDGVAQVLAEYIEERSERLNMGKPPRVNQLIEGTDPTPIGEAVEWGQNSELSAMRIGDLCPECGHAALLNVEGCRKCYSCGYSEC